MEIKGHAPATPWWLLPLGRVHPVWWSGIGVLLIWVDYLAGPSARFPLLYTIPVILAAWYSGRWPAIALAVAVPLAHVTFLATVWRPGDLTASVAATVCSFCKSIRNNAGDWEPLEVFISTRSEARFSHGLCRSCGRLHYPDLDLEDALDGEPVTRQ